MSVKTLFSRQLLQGVHKMGYEAVQAIVDYFKTPMAMHKAFALRPLYSSLHSILQG